MKIFLLAPASAFMLSFATAVTGFLVPQNDNTTKFAVNGKAIPDVSFDIGESYAGLLPVSTNTSTNDTRSLYFWFFPTANEQGKDEITIWLNGGPGCSSMLGLLQEHGPFLWLPGTLKPVKNPWSWHTLTNMIYIDQPVGTGFSRGTPLAKTEEDIATEFLSFLHNLIDTFSLHNKKIYLTGESWAGFYIPYIAHEMLNRNDTVYGNLHGTLLYNSIIGASDTQGPGQVHPFVSRWQNILNLNSSTLARAQEMDVRCGYRSYRDKYHTYPPPQIPFPTNEAAWGDDCDVWSLVYDAAREMNPCFNEYDISAKCPTPWNVLGPTGAVDYKPDDGYEIYFDREDVKKAINAPLDSKQWRQCVNGVYRERNAPSSLGVLAGVVERSKRTVLAHGVYDFVLTDGGTRFAVQNMSWGGMQGFQEEPGREKFWIPGDLMPEGVTGQGQGEMVVAGGRGEMGIVHTERGLTWVENYGAGHLVPQFVPAAAYRQMQFLLGRIDSLTEG